MKITLFDEILITRESICGHFRPCGLGWGPIRGRLFENMLVVGRSTFSEITVFHERGRRGRSRRENSGKILAAAFSRRDFLMVLGVGWGPGK